MDDAFFSSQHTITINTVILFNTVRGINSRYRYASLSFVFCCYIRATFTPLSLDQILPEAAKSSRKYVLFVLLCRLSTSDNANKAPYDKKKKRKKEEKKEEKNNNKQVKRKKAKPLCDSNQNQTYHHHVRYYY